MAAAAAATSPRARSTARELGLGIPAGLVRGAQRFVRAGDVSLVQSDAAELCQRPSELPAQVGAELFAGSESLGFGFVAPTPQPQDLGSMNPTPPVETADGVRAGPALHRLGPLLGHVVLGEPLKRAYQLAVHDPGRQRVEITRCHSHAGFVEERETRFDITVENEQTRRCDPPDGGGRVVTYRADVDGAKCVHARALSRSPIIIRS